jgi:drug/metabolite transporter (DMT)-like permease
MKRVIAWALNPYVLLTLTMAVGSANLVAGRGVVGEVPPLTLSFWRWFTAVMVVLPFGIRPLIAQRQLFLRHWRLLLFISAVGIAAFNSFLYLGLQTTTALNGSLILAAIPVCTVAIAWIVFREHIGWPIALGMIAALLGVGTIILQGRPALLLDLAFNRGDILVLAAVLCWAVYSILLGRLPPGVPPMALMLVTAFLGWAMLIPFYVWDLAAGRHMVVTPAALVAIAYVGIFASVIGYAAFAKGVALLGANIASQFTYLNPLFGGAWAILLLGEELRTYHIAGGLLIFLGIYLATSRRSVRAGKQHD